MCGCPYCGRSNCVYAWQAPGTPVPAGVPIVDVPSTAMIAGPQAGSGGFGFPTAQDWLGGLVACLQGALAGAATGAGIGSAAAGIGALPGAIVGGIVGCGAGIASYALAQMVKTETEKKQTEFAAQQSAQFQAQIAEQQKSLESGLAGGVGGLPSWVIPAALAIVGVGLLARKKATA